MILCGSNVSPGLSLPHRLRGFEGDCENGNKFKHWKRLLQFESATFWETNNEIDLNSIEWKRNWGVVPNRPLLYLSTPIRAEDASLILMKLAQFINVYERISFLSPHCSMRLARVVSSRFRSYSRIHHSHFTHHSSLDLRSWNSTFMLHWKTISSNISVDTFPIFIL